MLQGCGVFDLLPCNTGRRQIASTALLSNDRSCPVTVAAIVTSLATRLVLAFWLELN